MQSHQSREIILTPQEYQELASRTESTDFEAIRNRMNTVRAIRLQHAQLGIASEAGEIADQLKKSFFYGKTMDTVNLAEELGDLFWYMALAANELGINFDKIMETNIAKLKKRYGDKFSEVRAVTRNLDVEREILEGTMRPAVPGDGYEHLFCDQCGKQCNEVPFYCMHCGIDFGMGKGGGVIRLAEPGQP
jgi:NTP pyrophosphatase (non-canonical NTP hydrolase)